MCGVVALLCDPDERARDRVQAALGTLAHRGPDGEGVASCAGGRVWLGHRRLAIVDVAGGAQPLASEDGQVTAVVNGEIYDDAALRAALELRGHVFSTRSDSELVVHLYEEHGASFVERVRGELAFVLFDARRGRLVAGRDRFGIKPLVWARLKTGVAIASEAKALFSLGVRPQWDGVSLRHMVAHQYLPPERTLFAGVHAVPPGVVIEVDLDGRVAQRRYWQLSFAAPRANRDVHPHEARAQVRSLLDEAVRLRLRSDVPVGVYLSGGLDSASVLALAAAHGKAPHAFAIAFDRAPYDERVFAAAAAAHVGAPLTLVEVRQRDLVDALPSAVRMSEGIAINGQLVAKHLLARAARAAGVPVVLTGEGADEAFLGYPHLRADALGALAPRPSDAIAAGVMMPRDDAAPALDEVRERLGFVPTFLRAKAAFGIELCGLLDAGWRGPDAWLAGSLTALCDRVEAPRGGVPVQTAAALWTQTALAGYILRTLGDGTEMAFSIEGRPPFLDHVLFEYAFSLPISLRIDDTGREKAVLRDAVSAIIPPQIAARPKQPLIAPSVLASEPDRARDLLESVLPGLAFVDARATRRWLDEVSRRDASARIAAEPVWTTLTTAGLLARAFSLAAPDEARS